MSGYSNPNPQAPTASARLLDAYRAALGLSSDYKAAKALGVSPSAASAWRCGRAHISTANAQKMAQAAGLNADAVISEILAEATTVPDEARAFENLAQAMRVAQILRDGIAKLPKPERDHLRLICNEKIDSLPPAERATTRAIFDADCILCKIKRGRKRAA